MKRTVMLVGEYIEIKPKETNLGVALALFDSWKVTFKTLKRKYKRFSSYEP